MAAYWLDEGGPKPDFEIASYARAVSRASSFEIGVAILGRGIPGSNSPEISNPRERVETVATRDIRVCVAHEWLVAYGGSERCVEEMMRIFDDAVLITTVSDRSAMPASFPIARTSFLQAIPSGARHHEWLLPLMPLSWALRRLPEGVDALISSSHACAKAAPIGGGVPHLCYCHTPMRYAWDFAGERQRFPRPLQPIARAGAVALRRWDRSTSARVTRFVANSRAVAARIERSYGRRAEVVHPPVRTDFFTPGGQREDYFVYVGRLVAYKRPDLVVEAFADLPFRLLVVGEGHFLANLQRRATSNVSFVSQVTDDSLRDLLRGARALVFPGDEDFGITMAEAQACGTPVIGLSAGGALDIVQDGVTGWLLDRQNVAELRRAVRRAADEDLDVAAIRANAMRFSAPVFREGLQASVAAMLADPRPV